MRSLRAVLIRSVFFLAVWVVVPGCADLDKGTATTAEGDYTLTVQLTDRFLGVGDGSLLLVRLERTDGSNLDPGFSGRISLAASAHLELASQSVPFVIEGSTTQAWVATLSYTAALPGVGEIQATFTDAFARVEVLVTQGVQE